ncbi:PadR family transcriptional regulator [Actinoallomurus soli]|uniref:PadR family transcriptional regulator n=1 Tax=Actinoallomurus soli TaxID=2952535 RepID=UPI0020928085|nr:helix-turn-helix transcriptional regulator [Actinoallomurus soli]MCO5972570.1 helix-turn-helix transcriptional regulator [Actinoallomurus soli]
MDAVRGHLDGLVLAVLATGPAHGYRLIDLLRERSGGFFELPEGSVYPALHRLERAGLIESGWSAEEGRRRRVYALTAGGRRAVDERRREWRSFSAAVDAIFGTGA